jgi:hypothetical protein
MTSAHDNRWPATLPLNEAAEYCGLSVQTFKEVCPVKPISFTQSTRGDRYRRASLDDWLASIDPNKQALSPDRMSWGERLGGKRENART